jgi:hypothetical protein
MSVPLAWRFVRSHPHFVVRGVHVVGIETVPAAEVLDLLGVPTGVSIWDVDLAAARERVRGHAWVADAWVRRRLPGEIVVTVRERRAVAALVTRGAIHAVDHRGHLIAPLSADAAAGLTSITGIDATGCPQGDDGAPVRRATSRAVNLIRALNRHHPVTEIRIDCAVGLSALTADLPGLPLHFGWGAWRRKRRRLDTVLDLWSGREAHLELIRLDFDDRVVVRLRKNTAASVLWFRG